MVVAGEGDGGDRGEQRQRCCTVGCGLTSCEEKLGSRLLAALFAMRWTEMETCAWRDLVDGGQRLLSNKRGNRGEGREKEKGEGKKEKKKKKKKEKLSLFFSCFS